MKQIIKQDFVEWQKDQEAKAAEWLAANKSELADFECPEQSLAIRKGFEILDTMLSDIAQEETGQGFWEESDQEESLLEACGHMNVQTLECWNGTQKKDYSGAPVGTRFVPTKHARKDRLAAKNRARHGIEFCYDKAGRVRKTGNVQESKARAVEIKTLTVKRKLSKLDRRLAAVEARNARFAK